MSKLLDNVSNEIRLTFKVRGQKKHIYIGLKDTSFIITKPIRLKWDKMK